MPARNIRRQRRIAQHFLVMPVQQILHVGIQRGMAAELVPSSRVHPRVTSGVRVPQAQKVRVRTPSDERASQRSSVARPVIGQQQRPGVLRTQQQRIARSLREGPQRRSQNLRRGVKVGALYLEARLILPLKSSSAPCANDLFMLMYCDVVPVCGDLIMVERVEVGGRRGHARAKLLLHARLQVACLFRLQPRIRKYAVSGQPERLLEARFLDSLAVASLQPSSGQQPITPPRQISQRNPRNHPVAEAPVVHISAPRQSPSAAPLPQTARHTPHRSTSAHGSAEVPWCSPQTHSRPRTRNRNCSAPASIPSIPRCSEPQSD